MKYNLGNGISTVHFIGIGGISMSGLAEILHRDGYTVSGSDWTASGITKHLSGMGIDIKLGNDAAHVESGIDLVVYTAAVKPGNPEFAEAKRKNIPVMDRAKLLGLIMEQYKYSIAVAGVHGKTTTTAIVAEMLLAADLDPTISIGGFMEALSIGADDGKSLSSNFRTGSSPYFVLEACEYFDSFLQFYPHIGIILNIDSDHLDYFGTLDRLVDSFSRFAKNIPPDGTLIIHKDIPHLEQVTKGLKCNIITYGASSAHPETCVNGNNKARFWASNIRYDDAGLPSFVIMDNDKAVTEVNLQLRGAHNINNSLAAAAVASALDIPAEAVSLGLSRATGAKRRFEHKGTYQNITIVDDYAHHPTEVKASLAAAVPLLQSTHKRIICAFQSHTYSRTQNLLEEFSAAFDDADIVLILPIYAAREVSFGPYPNYLAERLTEGINKNGTDAYFVEDFPAAASWIKTHSKKDDLLITMGAGDIHILGEGLISGEF